MSRSGVRSTMQIDGMISCAIGKHFSNPGQEKTLELSDVGGAMVFSRSLSIPYSRPSIQSLTDLLAALGSEPLRSFASALSLRSTHHQSEHELGTLAQASWRLGTGKQTTRKVSSAKTKSQALRSSSNLRGHYPTRRSCRASLPASPQLQRVLTRLHCAHGSFSSAAVSTASASASASAAMAPRPMAIKAISCHPQRRDTAGGADWTRCEARRRRREGAGACLPAHLAL
ncbi:uncharacterized protein IWZ02DRAFT_75410 [Phyllosticta citriasiana]|uniref:uncharacterized protein n=1 Tax=Phyllosticta citriasiana TaxID=595635 RepID=UPI0030FDF5DC